MIRAFSVLVALLTLAGCSKDAPANRLEPSKVKFRVQEVADKDQGGLIAVRFAAPQDWKANGLLEWHYSDLYTPVRFSSRAESPDGSAWIETYPAELFFWLDPRWDNFKQGANGSGIHYTNVTIQQAMQRYVIQRYRGEGEEPEDSGLSPREQSGEGLEPTFHRRRRDRFPGAIRIRWRDSGRRVFRPHDAEADHPVSRPARHHLRIPSRAGAGAQHRGQKRPNDAKGGKLESVRPLLGYIARSYEVDKVWEKQRDVVIKQLVDAYNRNLAAGYAQIEAAGRLSRSISANNDAMIKAIDERRDEQRAASNATRSSSPSENTYKGSRGFRSVHPGHREGGGFLRQRLGTVQPVQLSLDGWVRKLRAFQRLQFRPQ